MISWMVLLLLFFATTTGAAGVVLMKIGMKKFKLKTILKNYQLILGIGLFGLSTLFFITSLNYGNLAINYSLTGMTYVWLLPLSKKYLNENITFTKLIGTTLIILGIILLSI